ncbi:MAG: ABC transporter ATP-binding protein [Hydrogenibacillus sp.]|nr:ABC transporter ATP-binding protein [Hydrogenibacillus sp.]
MRVELDAVTMRFGDVAAVDGLSATFESGELIGLLGPSGCGKSTTLFMLAGLYRPTSGEIRFDGTVVNDVPPERRSIGMVFQNYALYPHMTVFDNIAFPLRMQKVPKAERQERVLEMARLVRIEHLLGRKPAQLSGGQQQRVAIARSLVKRPKLLLLDEPLSNLDARLRLEMREEIRRIQRAVGITTVFVTHDQEEAMSLSDRILIMEGGRRQQFAAPQVMYDRPASRFVAFFLGNPPINLLSARYRQDGSVLVFPDGTRLAVDPTPYAGLDDELPVTVGIRPEAATVQAPDEIRSLDDTGHFIGTVAYRETIGRDTLIRVDLAEGVLRLLVPAHETPPLGARVVVIPDRTRLHLFRESDGRALHKDTPDDAQATRRVG